MTRCKNCGGEVEEGRSFCPHCGEAVAAGVESAGARGAVAAMSPPAPPMAGFGRRPEEADKSRRVIYIAVAVVAALLVAGVAYLAGRPSARPGEERLEGAVRPGSPDFPLDKLLVDFDPNEHALIGPTALGPWAVTMKPVVRNFTGRTVSGLEFRAVGVDVRGQTIRERTYVSRDEIEPNKTFTPSIGLNFPQDNKPADLKLELTGVRFK